MPDFLHELLKEQARQNRRSINQEAIFVFERALVPEKPSRETEVAEVIARNRELRSRMKQFLTDEEIKTAKEEGRM